MIFLLTTRLIEGNCNSIVHFFTLDFYFVLVERMVISWIAIHPLFLQNHELLFFWVSDKGELYIYFTFLYLVFVSCLSSFCELLHVIFILQVIFEQKDQRGDEKGPKMLKMEKADEHAQAWFGMTLSHTKIREQHAAA